MKKYYRGPIKRIEASKIKKDENNNLSYDKKIKTIEENVLFYKNFVDALIKHDDGNPIFREDEIHDIINLIHEESGINNCSLDYVDQSELKVEKNTPLEAKVMKKRKSSRNK